MATIVTRAGKGSALTFVEGDANFTNLNTDKIELTSLSVGSPASASGSGSIAYDNTTGVFTYTPPVIPSAGLGSLNDDSTPQLGSNLDVNDFAITTTVTNGNIVIAPNGAGVVELGGDAINGYDGGVVIKPGATDGNGVIVTETGIDMAIATDAGSGLGAYIQMFAAGGIELTSNGSTTIDGLVYPNADGTAGQFITTDGAGTLGFTSTLEGAGLVDYREAPYALTYASTITPDAANGNVQIVTLTGNVTMNALGNPVSGQSLTLIVKQDATGSRTLTSSMKFAGGDKTLTTAANSIDIITVFYDGTNYWASLGKDFK